VTVSSDRFVLYLTGWIKSGDGGRRRSRFRRSLGGWLSTVMMPYPQLF
jgi:hypothetical protein